MPFTIVPAPDYPTHTVITQDLIDAGASDAGGWTREQFVLLGFHLSVLSPHTGTPPRGWRRSADGRYIPIANAHAFLARKNSPNDRRAQQPSLFPS